MGELILFLAISCSLATVILCMTVVLWSFDVSDKATFKKRIKWLPLAFLAGATWFVSWIPAAYIGIRNWYRALPDSPR